MDPLVPSILSISMHDPVGRAWLPAESIIIANQGCHSLSVISAISLQDTVSNTPIIQTLDAHIVNDQARTILEDITPNVIKVSAIFETELCIKIAQLFADYPDCQKILVMGPAFVGHTHLEKSLNQTNIIGYINIMAPLADTIIIDASYFDHWLTDDEDEITLFDYISYSLQSTQIKNFIVIGQDGDNSRIYNSLYNQKGRLDLPELNNINLSPESLEIFASYLSCALAKNEPIELAAHYAIKQLEQASQTEYSLGMGRSIPSQFNSF